MYIPILFPVSEQGVNWNRSKTVSSVEGTNPNVVMFTVSPTGSPFGDVALDDIKVVLLPS